MEKMMPATPATPKPQRILSGVQPSGKLHLGNYFGAIKQHIELQDQGECFFFIADYHALTTIRDTAKTLGEGGKKPLNPAELLRQFTFDVAVDYLALGLDPNKVAFFRQSDVPEVCELAWILETVTNMGLLEKATSYKDKVEKGIEASVGLFTYPALMAADIIIYRSNLVPVGEDQVQHIEITRDMAERFNRAFDKEVFPLPTHRLTPAKKVPGIDGQKMSKSYGNTIDIFAEGNPLKKTVMGIVTDTTPREEPKNPTGNTVVALYNLFATPEEVAKLESLYRNPLEDADRRNNEPFGYGHAKTMLLEKINSYFAAARQRRKELAARPGDVEDILREGAKRARVEAQKTMELVRAAVGMGPRPVGT
jgi:tryptophanyl-tRNA synthetase